MGVYDVRTRWDTDSAVGTFWDRDVGDGDVCFEPVFYRLLGLVIFCVLEVLPMTALRG